MTSNEDPMFVEITKLLQCTEPTVEEDRQEELQIDNRIPVRNRKQMAQDKQHVSLGIIIEEIHDGIDIGADVLVTIKRTQNLVCIDENSKKLCL